MKTRPINKRRVASLIVGAAIFLTVSVCAQQVMASDYKNSKFPTFDGVKQVYVHVHYVSLQTKEEKDALPAALRRETIEAVLMQLYKERFSSTDCEKRLKGVNPYSCDDQPVILVPDQEYDTYQSREARKKSGTLNIEFQVVIETTDPIGTPLKPTLAAFYLIQDRPELQFPTEWEITHPMSLPTNLSDDSIRQSLFTYIDTNIR